MVKDGYFKTAKVQRLFMSSLKHTIQSFKNSPEAEALKVHIVNSAWSEAYILLLKSYITTLGRYIGVQS